MGAVDEINVTITGQVKGDITNTKRLVLAELEVICSSYDLEMEINN